MSRIFWIIMIVCVVIFGAAWYIHRSKTHAVNSGDVFVRGQSGEKTKAATPAPETPSTDQPEQGQQPATAAATDTPAGAPAQGDVVAPPATDSISRNPPNGMIFAGTGKYQLYRQGDITWRLNTDTGQACVLFATDAEWRRPLVYQHGCGSN